ncbi:MAG: 5-formyltetrahydrofolate cyclo-ligase, partial [Nocardioides sp.]|nr:5-formyltetrahydrofolate cyclo-ligase [Nocardioides sp.]
RRVTLYAAVGTEPDTRPLIEALHRAGVEVLLPVVLVPGLAVSARGERLGRGGGCYDRALARVGDVPVVVVLHPEEVGVDVPVEPHDRPVTHVLTAGGVSAISRPA